jgi:quercetin dioxygenase-like cupin family protein
MNDYLKKLREMTPRLTDLSHVRACGSVEYSTENNGAPIVGTLLKNTGLVAVQDAMCKKGTTILEHFHEEVEYLIVYKGEIEAHYSDGRDSVVVRCPDLIRFEPGEAHKVTANEDACVIGITIPASPGYPNA